MCAMCIFVIYYISFSGEPCLIYYMHLNLHHHPRIDFYSLWTPCIFFCTPKSKLASDTFTPNYFYCLMIWTWSWIPYSLLWHFVGGFVCFLPRSTWILLNLPCVLPQDCGVFFTWFAYITLLFGGPPLSDWVSSPHKLWGLGVDILLCGSQPATSWCGDKSLQFLCLNLGQTLKVLYTSEVPYGIQLRLGLCLKQYPCLISCHFWSDSAPPHQHLLEILPYLRLIFGELSLGHSFHLPFSVIRFFKKKTLFFKLF